MIESVDGGMNMAKKKLVKKQSVFGGWATGFILLWIVCILMVFALSSEGSKIDALNAKVASLEMQQVNTSTQISDVVKWDNSFAGSVIYTFGEVQNYTDMANARMNAAEYSLKQAGIYRLPPSNVTVSLK